jgi:hypothetical protein
MRAFACPHCANLVFFENSICLRCSTKLRFDPERFELVAVSAASEVPPDCANLELAGCNWVAPAARALCRCCRLTRTRPSDDDAAGLAAFIVAERAKRRAIAQLLEFGLPDLEDGKLAFDLLSSEREPVTTGHADGVITIDLAEGDDARREARRIELGEAYRTMLGHLRHELGHFAQPRLLIGEADWQAARSLFGDDRADYGVALERHYAEGAPVDWRTRHVSAYAAMHPWEDWAETFAHYLHIQDTVGTAAAFGVRVDGPSDGIAEPSLRASPPSEPQSAGFAEVLASWLPLSMVLNAISRSVGRDDLYPFALAPAVIRKLSFVHDRFGALRTA